MASWSITWNVAQAKRGPVTGGQSVGSDPAAYRDPDWERNMWWEDRSNGDTAAWQRNTGNGWNQNTILPIAPDPVSGQQAFHSTVVRIERVGV